MRTILLLLLLTLAAAINPVVIKGNKFFDSVTGQQFYVIGVDYQPSPDPLADIAGLNRDIPLLKDLGVNCIRVYRVDVTKDHSVGMKMLSDSGIYVMIDATDPAFSISSDSPSWTMEIFSGIKAKVDNFLGFDNIIGFLCGNEVINDYDQTAAAAYVKASIRDLKAYIKSRGYSVPVGYAATDVPANNDLQKYLDCFSRDSSVDFYGINTYRWCGQSNYETSGFSQFGENFADYHAPFLLTEYGCNTEGNRTFTEVAAMYGPQMTGYLSGGFAYEWSQEVNNYGLVSIAADGTVTKFSDYNNFKAQVAAIKPTRATLSSYQGTTATVDVCPSVNSLWLSAASPLPPTPDATFCECMVNSLSCRTAVTDIAQAASVDEAIEGALSLACSSVSCSEITGDSKTGVYGVYSACNSLQKASFVLNEYYTKWSPSQGAAACSFNGLGQVVTPTTSQCALPTGPGAPVTAAPATRPVTPVTPSAGSGNQNSNGGVVAPQTLPQVGNTGAGQQTQAPPATNVVGEQPVQTVDRGQQGSGAFIKPLMLVVVAFVLLL